MPQAIKCTKCNTSDPLDDVIKVNKGYYLCGLCREEIRIGATNHIEEKLL